LWVDGSLAESHLAAMVNSWTINAGDGDDTLTVDYSGGEFDADITFHGEGENGPPGDRLVVTGASAGVVTHTFVNASDGNIEIDGQRTISYTGLEPITDNLDAADRVFTF